MGDVLIRGLSEAAIARIDADAAARGLSRQEYLRTRFESEGMVSGATRAMTVDDLRRAAAAATDLDDPDVMDSAWR
ncbi:hypothetical protein [Micromonospora sp. WMMD737]|uniref:type II toxin-antitoxin system VapB family antitoxin n=1 Tax=Actinomycetes TaxID=1760 RepID=UPI003B9461F4